MTLQVIGAGVGRTGTYSLRMALNRLGLGPCYHMEDVLQQKEIRVPQWSAALAGAADWGAIYEGFGSAVDWPTAGFFRELNAAYPSSRFILTVRSPQSWAESYSQTIFKLVSGRDQAPEDMRPWLDMGGAVASKSGMVDGLDVEGLKQAFIAHNEAVAAEIPADRLLTFEVKEGWGPLCAFLELPVPDEPFPRTNDRGEFWDLVSAAT